MCVFDKKTALRIARKQNKKIKFFLWKSHTYIWYDEKEKVFKSAKNKPVKKEVLSNGFYEVIPSNSKHLSGLFNLI